jgi:hypothetical protein
LCLRLRGVRLVVVHGAGHCNRGGGRGNKGRAKVRFLQGFVRHQHRSELVHALYKGTRPRNIVKTQSHGTNSRRPLSSAG